MNRYQNQLAGLSYPINLFSVILHVLAVFTIVFSQLNCCQAIEPLMLWIGIPCLVVSLGVILLFKGYYLLVQHARLVAGFLLLIISLIHLSALSDFGTFLSRITQATEHPYHFLHGVKGLNVTLSCIEFVVGMALIIGAWIRPMSAVMFVLFAFYTHLFFLQTTIIESNSAAAINFGIDQYLIAELNNWIAFTFCLFIAVISLVGIIFGNKIKSNSVKLNWGIIPVYTVLCAGLAIFLHWYALIFIVPLSISLALITYRSGGRWFGNHFGALLVATGISLTIAFFQKQLGIDRKPKANITNKK